MTLLVPFRRACAWLPLAFVLACTPPEVPYADRIATWQADQNRFMREADASPIPPNQRATFPPLLYFPIDPAYRVPAGLTVARSDVALEMPTSTGQRRKMLRVGSLAFILKGQSLTLTAFVDATEADMRRLFVPFLDLTTGTETYTGGRYLDLERTASGVYDLDFNRAYHPYCVYNPSYDCPYPPRENRLTVPVRAGQRLGSTAKP